MKSVFVEHYTATSCLGAGVSAHNEAFGRGQSGLTRNDIPRCELDTWIGRVDDSDFLPFPTHMRAFEARNNLLAWTGLQADGFAGTARTAIDRHGPDRVAVIIGTSTSSIGETELAYSQLESDGSFSPRFVKPRVHNPHSPGDFVARSLGASGPCMTIGTACSSSAKVFAAAARWLSLDIADAVVVGGVDTLCLSVLYGFHSLQLVSKEPTCPFDISRAGISIGEAAGFALLVRSDEGGARGQLLGFGESSDAHHMSSPHPEGVGALLAARSALDHAGLDPVDIDYINLHGTGTRHNDLIEGNAMRKLFTDPPPASSTKGWTGHTLGAAGILEAVICLNAIETGLLPRNINSSEIDPSCNLEVLTDNLNSDISIAMTNSYGFGGNNCSLIFGRP